MGRICCYTTEWLNIIIYLYLKHHILDGVISIRDWWSDKGSYRRKHSVISGREGQWRKVGKMIMEGEVRDGKMDCRNVRFYTLFVSGFIPDIINCGREKWGCGNGLVYRRYTRRKAIRFSSLELAYQLWFCGRFYPRLSVASYIVTDTDPESWWYISRVSQGGGCQL